MEKRESFLLNTIRDLTRGASGDFPFRNLSGDLCPRHAATQMGRLGHLGRLLRRCEENEDTQESSQGCHLSWLRVSSLCQIDNRYKRLPGCCHSEHGTHDFLAETVWYRGRGYAEGKVWGALYAHSEREFDHTWGHLDISPA